ncbi:MAG: YggS family pyridoxal phosphate-dependent enzyme [Helicobacteraceae bacterium]|jgi:pyridoxal phosphate enzyme (YggS family)|nr:YggS family pyridoxal phosphate-dependent enzyme [Helicobacteraceae bacterium]
MDFSAFDAAIERVEKARLAYDSRHITQIVAASKYVDSAAIAALYGYGQRAFGENRAQDLAAKSAELENLPIEWHFIGVLQSNKIAKLLALRPALIHSVSSLELARAINDRAAQMGIIQRVLLQVNSAREKSKSGVLPEAALETYAAIKETCPALVLEGVMTIGARAEDQNQIAASFKTAREIRDQTGGKTLSMGMSGDFEIAISFGANLLRLGSVLFKN